MLSIIRGVDNVNHAMDAAVSAVSLWSAAIANRAHNLNPNPKHCLGFGLTERLCLTLTSTMRGRSLAVEMCQLAYRGLYSTAMITLDALKATDTCSPATR